MKITISGGEEELADLQPGDEAELSITVSKNDGGELEADLTEVEKSGDSGEEEDEEEPDEEDMGSMMKGKMSDKSAETGGGRDSGTDKPVAFLAMGLRPKGKNDKFTR